MNALRLAERQGIESIAFPAISTGIFSFPIEAAAGVALETVLEELPRLSFPTHIRFVLFDEESQQIYEGLLDELSRHVSLPSDDTSAI